MGKAAFTTYSGHNFDRMISPRAIAVVGASATPTSIGGQPFRFLTEFGYQGKVYPVNPKYQELKGLTCYADLVSVPSPCDLALIAVGAPHVATELAQCDAAGIPFAIVMSSGFREIGETGMQRQQEIEAVLEKSKVRLLGPNCIGMLNLNEHIHCGFGGSMSNSRLRAGTLAIVSQSGGWGMGMVEIADQAGCGFNYVVSTGNETDITALEMIAYFLEREDTQAVVAYLEGTTDGRRLLAIGERALQLGKPVLMWKVGNTDSGRRAATSHTGRLTAGHELFQRAMRAGGFIEVSDVDDIVDIAQLLRYQRPAKGKRVVIITSSGGAGVQMADYCEQNNLEVPVTTSQTLHRIRQYAPDFSSLGNPIDLTPSGYSDPVASYTKLIAEVMAAPDFDQAIVRSVPGNAAIVSAWVTGFLEMLKKTDKPVVITWGAGSEQALEAKQLLAKAGVPSFVSLRRTARALGSMSDFTTRIEYYRKRHAMPQARLVAQQQLSLPAGALTLGERLSKQLLAAYGIPVVREVLLTIEAVEALSDSPLPFPVAVKIESADLPHKTEAGAVRIGVQNLDELKSSAREILTAARNYKRNARIDGILVQEIASGTEVIVGAVNDPYFGPTVMFGLGGVFTEIMHDVTHRFAPFDLRTAHEMIAGIKGAPLLTGYRGKPAGDIAALADTLVRVSLMIADHQDRIAEIDINPLFVRPAGQGVLAADALLVLK